jgi:hypothetical protein
VNQPGVRQKGPSSAGFTSNNLLFSSFSLWKLQYIGTNPTHTQPKKNIINQWQPPKHVRTIYPKSTKKTVFWRGWSCKETDTHPVSQPGDSVAPCQKASTPSRPWLGGINGGNSCNGGYPKMEGL